MKKIILFLVIGLLLALFLNRALSPREIDDISPEIFCEQEYIEKADILWVIPKFNNKPISDDKEWCEYILSLNKTLGLHGVIHEREEFATDRNQKYIKEGIKIFEDCFNQTPTMFKPPQLEISTYNRYLIIRNKLERKGKLNAVLHKVYHCGDTGIIPNKIIDLF
jgi:predicted deacetylase